MQVFKITAKAGDLPANVPMHNSQDKLQVLTILVAMKTANVTQIAAVATLATLMLAMMPPRTCLARLAPQHQCYGSQRETHKGIELSYNMLQHN